MDKDCVFCKIIKRDIPSKIEFENNDVIAFRTIQPIAPTHILIIPKKHIKNLSEASDSDNNLLGEIMIVARDLAKKLGISEAFRVAAANGDGAGQSVFHMHFHLTGGWKKKYEEAEDQA
ncbi:MAG: histidine triad nucleotide-binding protein [bacterium]